MYASVNVTDAVRVPQVERQFKGWGYGGKGEEINKFECILYVSVQKDRGTQRGIKQGRRGTWVVKSDKKGGKMIDDG